MSILLCRNLEMVVVPYKARFVEEIIYSFALVSVACTAKSID